MDFPINIDVISMGLSILHFKGSKLEFSKVSPSMIYFYLSNNPDPDKMQLYALMHKATFNLGLHYLQKYSFRSFQHTRAYSMAMNVWKNKTSLTALICMFT